MTDDDLLALVKRVDPQAVRLPPGIKAIAAEIEAVEREACAILAEDFIWWEHEGCSPDQGNEFISRLIRQRSNK